MPFFFFFSLFFFLLNTFESRLVSKMGISVHLGKGQALKDLMCALLRRSYCSIWRSFRMMWHATCWSSLFFSLEIAKNARVHSPQIFHCYCFTLQAFRLILTICLVRFVNLFANELFDLSHICFCSFLFAYAFCVRNFWRCVSKRPVILGLQFLLG